MDCKSEWQKRNYRGSGNPAYNSETVQGDWCETAFERRKSVVRDNNFCSRECYGRWRAKHYTGENSSLWRGGSDLTACEQCGIEYSVRPSKKADSRFCSRACLYRYRAENASGQASVHWRGGVSIYDAVKRLLGDESWNRTRSRIRDRADGCAMCREDPDEQELDVHHVVPILVGGTNEDWNLLPLCRGCHTTVEQFTRDLCDPVLVEES